MVRKIGESLGRIAIPEFIGKHPSVPLSHSKGNDRAYVSKDGIFSRL